MNKVLYKDRGGDKKFCLKMLEKIYWKEEK